MRTSAYSEEFRMNALQKLLSPGSPGLREIAENIGIPWSTLYSWKRKYASKTPMKKNKRIENWSLEQKLEAVVKTSSMSENELGEYLRGNGLHSSDVESFKMEFLKTASEKGRPKLDPEVARLRTQNKTLERELKRKDTALAEYCARVILLKKSHEIWGDPEEGE